MIFAIRIKAGEKERRKPWDRHREIKLLSKCITQHTHSKKEYASRYIRRMFNLCAFSGSKKRADRQHNIFLHFFRSNVDRSSHSVFFLRFVIFIIIFFSAQKWPDMNNWLFELHHTHWKHIVNTHSYAYKLQPEITFNQHQHVYRFTKRHILIDKK